jgi:hypothetical protein
MTLRNWRTWAAAVALVVVACQQDHPDVTEPEGVIDGPPRGAFSIAGSLTCRADVAAQNVSCRPRPLVTGELGPQFLIVGGQGVYVQLVSTNVSYNSTTEVFQANVQVGNLLGDEPGTGQPLGTPDGLSTTGIRVFFHAGPTVTSGSGAVTVLNPDGTGMFTGSNQPYHAYDIFLPAYFISGAKTWQWDVPSTVATFEFEVFVEADVPHPNGFVYVSPEATTTTVSGNVQIIASIRTVVNGAGTGTVTFSSSDPTIATVDPQTGVVTGVAPGTVNIIAASSGAEDDGVATVMIPEAGFQIELQYLTSATTAQQQAFANAVTRWESHLTGDLPSMEVNTLDLLFCGGTPIAQWVDDLVIQVVLAPIDGAGGILGQAGPCALRGSNALPAFGIMQFDTDDLAALEANDQLEAAILHEMGHVLGFGVLWDASLLNLRVGTGTSDPRFTGSAAIAAYVGIGGTGAQCSPLTTPCVPLEPTGGTGTRDAHWREASCGACESTDYFGNELMTGYISAPGVANPLSIVSISQFTDLGYPGVVTTGADAFTLNPSLVAGAPGAAPLLQLVDDIWRGPVYRIDDDGKLRLVLPDRR